MRKNSAKRACTLLLLLGIVMALTLATGEKKQNNKIARIQPKNNVSSEITASSTEIINNSSEKAGKSSIPPLSRLTDLRIETDSIPQSTRAQSVKTDRNVSALLDSIFDEINADAMTRQGPAKAVESSLPVNASGETTQTAVSDNIVKEKNAVERMKEIIAQIEGNHQIFSSSAGDFALAATENGYTLTTPDGTVYEFTASEEGLSLATSGGTVCPFIAGSEEYSLGKMTDDAFVLITASEQEYTLKVNNPPAEPASSGNEEPEKTITQLVLDDLISSTEKELLGVFRSRDNNYAMMITDDSNHILVSADGSQHSFTPTDSADLFVTPSGTEAPLVAAGDGIAIASLTDDSYVLMTESINDELAFEEYTLFEDNLSSDINDNTLKTYTSSTTDTSTGSDQQYSSAAGTDASSISSGSAADSLVASTDATSSPSILDNLADISTSSTGSSYEKPLWMLSIAEQRVLRRIRYDRI